MANQFSLNNLRELLSETGEAIHLETQIIALEKTHETDLVFDLTRTIIETICKTILGDREKAVPSGFGDLLRSTYDEIKDSLARDEKEREEIQALIDALNGIIQVISNLRHQLGLASHGRDAYSPAANMINAEFVVRIGEAIACYLYKAHRNGTGTPVRLMEYEDYPEFNENLDDVVGPIEIYDSRFSPSEVLFHFDKIAYNNYRIDHEAEATET